MTETPQSSPARLEINEPARPDIDNLNRLAQSLDGQDLNAAREAATQAYDLAVQVSYANGMAEALLTLASLDERQGNFTQAIQQATQAQQIALAISRPDLICKAHYILAWVSYDLSDYPRAMDHAVQQLRLAETTQNLSSQAEAHNSMGAIYGMTEDDGLQSIAHYQHSLTLYRQLGLLERQAMLLNNLCVAYGYVDQYQEALIYGLQALDLHRQAGNTYSEVMVLGNLGVAYMNLNQSEEAHTCFTRRLEITRQQGYLPMEAHTLLNMGRLLLRQGDAEAALMPLQRALALAEQEKYLRFVYECHEEIALAHEKLGSLAEALKHYRQFHQLESQFRSEEGRTQVERVRQAFEIEKMRADLEQERLNHRHFERLNRLKDDLINTASHDLKNPLASIFLSLGLLQQHLADHDLRIQKLLGRLKRDADRMRDLISYLLDQSYLETGSPLRLESLLLEPFLQHAIDDVQVLAGQKSISLHVSCSPLRVRIDPQRMRQALNNLLSNAIKYSPPGTRVDLTAQAEGEHLRLTVADAGIGIPAESLPHLFQPFYRVKHPDHQAQEGRGLGLWIVLSIIEQHGGTIEVTSVEGKGTTFIAMLPNAIMPMNE